MVTTQPTIERLHQWNTKRKRINHQQLKNQFIGQVERLCRAEKLGRNDIVEKQISWLRNEWRELGGEIEHLLKTYECEASPVAYLTPEVVGFLDDTFLVFLIKETHRNWVAARRVQEWRESGIHRCNRIQRLLCELEVDSGELKLSCRALCEHLQNYPSLHSPI
jgi:hypothetical protein